MMKSQRCKGARDLLPVDMAKFRHIEGIFRNCCSRWGYREVRTPTLEYLHLFTSAGTLTPSRLSKMYSFLDRDGWSGERVALRPEGTIPVARLYVDGLQERELVRLFYVENTFSFDEKESESRERWQGGAELIGGNAPATDAELILLASETLNELGCPEVQLRLSHMGFLRALLQELRPEEVVEVLDQILDGSTEVLDRIASDELGVRGLLSQVFDATGDSPAFLKNTKPPLVHAFPKIEPSLDDFIGIAELLSAVGCNYQIDMTSGQGFEYYTGITFQLYSGGERVGAGGRYDDLIPLVGGKNIVASGFALYMNQLMACLELPEVEEDYKCRVLVGSEHGVAEDWGRCLEAARFLRQRGYVSELDLGGGHEPDCRWLLQVRSGKRPFLLIDRSSDKMAELTSMHEVVEVLEGTRCG